MSRHLKALGRVPMLRKDRARAMVRGLLLAAALLSWNSVAAAESQVGELPPAIALPPRTFDALLYADLVVRGVILSVSVQQDLINSAMPMWPSADPGARTAIAHVNMAIKEVLAGAEPAESVQFLVYFGVSGVKQNYFPGQETVVGLVWGEEVLGGMYWLIGDQGRFIKEGEVWRRQDSGLAVGGMDDFNRIANARLPLRVLSDADIVVVGTLTSDNIEYRISDKGSEYVLLQYNLTDLDVLKGHLPTKTVEAQTITSGDYWPAWREDSTFPEHLEYGRRYCFFLRGVDGGYAVLRGIRGVYEVKGGALHVPGRRKKTDLTVEDVRLHAEAQQ